MAASLAHEVRNPLTTVKGFLALINESPEDMPKVKQYISICLHEVQRTESILSEYLSISKPLSDRCERMDLSEQLVLIRDVMLPFANMNNVELDVFRPDSPVFLIANPDAFKQALEIEDNGVGMNQEQIQRLGSIYFSTKSSGTGLGLTYSYQVIHLLGGQIAVSSKPNAGTKFTLTLPQLAQAVSLG